MKIAITSSGTTLDSQVDPRFGRAQYLLIVNTDTLEVETIQNPNAAGGGGAGIQTAQMALSKGAQAVLTGNCGPNAYRVLEAANVSVYAGVSGAVRAGLEAFMRGELHLLSGPSVAGHFGMGRSSGEAGST